MPADLDSVATVLSMNENVEDTAPPHFRALFDDEARAGVCAYQPVVDHERRKRAGCAAGRGIFDDAEFRCEHS